jgi:putative membrane protein
MTMANRISHALIAAGLVLVPAVAQAQASGDHPHYWGGGWGWGAMMFGPLMMIVFIAVIVVIAVLAVRWLGGGAMRPAPSDRQTALVILEERYARGEIDREEFEQKKQDLT